MDLVFYVTAAVTLVSTVLVITRRNPVHALLYFILSLIGVAVIFLDLGAPFVAALEIIIYAGAIMVLFIFVIMLLSPEPSPLAKPSLWIGPTALSLLLVAGLVYAVIAARVHVPTTVQSQPEQVGVALFGPYIVGVELASLLLLGGLVAAYHLGRRERSEERESQS